MENWRLGLLAVVFIYTPFFKAREKNMPDSVHVVEGQPICV